MEVVKVINAEGSVQIADDGQDEHYDLSLKEKAGIGLRKKAGKLFKRSHEFNWAKMAVMKRKNGTEKEKGSIKRIESPGLREGEFRILMLGVNSDQVNELEQSLYQIEGMRLLLIGGSAEEGTECVVYTDKPMALTDALKKMLFVEDTIENGNTIRVNTKTECNAVV